MLKSIGFSHFKSFGDNVKVPCAPFTLLIGGNAAGKSNLFDGIRFLQGCALGLSIADVLEGRSEGGREAWLGIRGGIAEAATSGRTEFVIQSVWQNVETLGDVETIRDVEHTLQCQTRPDPLLVAERLNSAPDGVMYFDTHAPALQSDTGLKAGGAIRVGVKRVGRGTSLTPTLSGSKSLLAQMGSVAQRHRDVDLATDALVRSLRAVQFLEITPSAMRDYKGKHQSEQILSRGENVSAVLWRLCQDSAKKAELVDWLSELLSPELADMEFVETRSPLNDVILVLVERNGRKISAKSLSDGTLKFLGELVALYTAPRGSLLLLEEIENGLHYRRTELLVQMFEKLCRKQGIQILATTHSPLILHSLSPATRDNAIIFARNPEDGLTIAKRLRDLPDYPAVVERRGIEHLMRTGWLERAV